MSLLFETIRIKDGIPQFLDWHEKRMMFARREIWHIKDPVNLKEVVYVDRDFAQGTVRCNVIYGPDIRAISFRKYEKKQIKSLKLVACDTIDYHLKFHDRSLLKELLETKGTADEIIIVKDGCITDTSMSNLIFRDADAWWTPSTPLLKGTTRERLLSEGTILEKRITPQDLGLYKGCKLINAMRLPEEEELIPVARILK
jgi:4-amino-4-deoxychorismate lyase